MFLYAKYNEDDEFSDVIYVPDNPHIDVELKQDMFFKWLFDKSHDHEYWKFIDGNKMYCEYDAEAFVKWLNEDIYAKFSEKAKVVKKRTSEEVSDSKILIF